MKNRKNDSSDASLHVDHLGVVHFVPGPPLREAILKKMYTYHLDRLSLSLEKTRSPFYTIIEKKDPLTTSECHQLLSNYQV